MKSDEKKWEFLGAILLFMRKNIKMRKFQQLFQLLRSRWTVILDLWQISTDFLFNFFVEKENSRVAKIMNQDC